MDGFAAGGGKCTPHLLHSHTVTATGGSGQRTKVPLASALPHERRGGWSARHRPTVHRPHAHILAISSISTTNDHASTAPLVGRPRVANGALALPSPSLRGIPSTHAGGAGQNAKPNGRATTRGGVAAESTPPPRTSRTTSADVLQRSCADLLQQRGLNQAAASLRSRLPPLGYLRKLTRHLRIRMALGARTEHGAEEVAAADVGLAPDLGELGHKCLDLPASSGAWAHGAAMALEQRWP